MDALGALARVEPRHVPPPERTARWAPRHESSDGILSEAEQRKTAYKEQPDWVCPACKKFYAEAVAEQAQDLQQPRPVEADGTRTS